MLKTMFPFWAAILANVLAQVLKPFSIIFAQKNLTRISQLPVEDFPAVILRRLRPS